MGTHVARTGEISDAHRVFVGKQTGGDHFEDLGADGKIIFKCEF
jgi:hypothetical protein